MSPIIAALLDRARRQLDRREVDLESVIDHVQAERLTFLEREALEDLASRVQAVDRARIPGVLIEAGCALGGSSIVLATAKSRRRPMEVYDVFGMIPPPTARDGEDVHRRYDVIARGDAEGFGEDLYYGYQPDLQSKVAASLTRFGVDLHRDKVSLRQGLFEDTLHPSGSVALAHVDGDWYESVKVCLERLWPALSPGGVLVIDDYDAWSGCRAAVDEFLLSTPQVIQERRSRLHLVKPSG